MKVVSLYKRECEGMKKLICAEDVEQLKKSGQQCLTINKQTIITPSARDLAEEYQITFQMESVPKENCLFSCEETISKEDLVVLLRQLLNNAEGNLFPEAPFDFEKHESGLKIVRGATVEPRAVSNDNPKVRYQEIVTPAESNFSAGLLVIENSSLLEENTQEAIQYVIDGELKVTIDGKSYTATKGDTLFIPKNQAVRWLAPDKATVLWSKLKGVENE